jgi:hypothetical protein
MAQKLVAKLDDREGEDFPHIVSNLLDPYGPESLVIIQGNPVDRGGW